MGQLFFRRLKEIAIEKIHSKISAGADKKHKKKHRKLKYNYVNSKNKKRKKHKRTREEGGLKNWQRRSHSKFHDIKEKEIPITDETKDKEVISNKVATQNRKSESSLRIPQVKEFPSECSRNDDCTKEMVEKTKTNSNSNRARAEKKSSKFAKEVKKETKGSELEQGQNVLAKDFYTKKFAERNSKCASIKENMKKLKKEKGKNEKKSEKVLKINGAWKELEKSPSKRKSLTVKRKNGNKSSKGSRSASELKKKKLKKINRKDGKNRSDSEKLSGKIRKKLEREGSKSAEESKTASESEKKPANKRGKSGTRKKGKHSEVRYESRTRRGKKKIRKSISEKSKIRKHKVKKLNGEAIPERRKDFPYKDERTEICAKETEVNGQNGISEKLKRVDAILASRSGKEKRLKSDEKLRIKRCKTKASESHGKKIKLSENLKHRGSEKTVATASSNSISSLASSQMPTALSITNFQTVTESYAAKSDINKAVKRNEISNDTTDGEEKKVEEGRTMVTMKKPRQVLKEVIDVSARKDDVRIQKDLTLRVVPEKDRKYVDDRKIMHVEAFIQKKGKIYDMTTTPERIRSGTSKTEESNSDVGQGTDVTSTFQSDTPKGMEQSMRTSVTSSEMDSEGRNSSNLEQKYSSNLDQTTAVSTEESHSATSSAELERSKEPTKIKEDVANDSGSMNTVSSSMKEQLNVLSATDNRSSKISIENITSSGEFQKKLNTDEKITKSLTSDKQNAKTDDECGRETNLEERNKQYYENEMKNDKLNDSVEANKDERKDRSYLDGLVEIRTILEIYGIDEEKKKAFDKLLDEDTPMNDKEIAQSLRKAVLKKMRQNGLLGRKEEKILQKNLVPEAVNESVTIALLAQVLQRQKLKKPMSYR
uniref:DEK C-terminal domain-containing protein n=1 Tax=Setaria digitata TaxID=48799 RepID=A0A915PXD6_9BILA